MEHLEAGYEWVVDLGLEKFFDRVPHQRLLARLSQRVGDPRLVGLIRRMLRAKVVKPDGVVVSNEEGTAQGGPLSPLLKPILCWTSLMLSLGGAGIVSCVMPTIAISTYVVSERASA